MFHVLFEVPKDKRLGSLIAWLTFYLVLVFVISLMTGLYVLIMILWALFKPLAIFLILLLLAAIISLAMVLTRLYQLWKQKRRK
ncbi:hypothetical protein BMI76_08970 [Streptococcus sp. 'caviae']|nr:hypothetical protein BMI76_08970 [Streptococcus sp. 'caviae']